MVERILVVEPEKRLGSVQRGGLKELKDHPFFDGFSWQALATQTPPKMASASGAAAGTGTEPPSVTPPAIPPKPAVLRQSTGELSADIDYASSDGLDTISTPDSFPATPEVLNNYRLPPMVSVPVSPRETPVHLANSTRPTASGYRGSGGAAYNPAPLPPPPPRPHSRRQQPQSQSQFRDDIYDVRVSDHVPPMRTEEMAAVQGSHYASADYYSTSYRPPAPPALGGRPTMYRNMESGSSRAVDNVHSDKVYLPSSYLSALLEKRSIESPLLFRVSYRAKQLFCGVREFSFDEGYVGIPHWLVDDDRLSEGDSVIVENIELSKGTFTRLHALDSSAQSIRDMRSLLEAHMRANLTVLFPGETVEVPVGGMHEPVKFRVVEVEPSNEAVDIVDTDLSVDILFDGASGSLTHEDNSNELGIGSATSIALDGGSTKDLCVHIPAQTGAVSIHIDCHEGDASVFASRIVQHPTMRDNTWFDCAAPSASRKTVAIDSSALPSGSNSIFVAIAASDIGCKATVSVTLDTEEQSSNAVQGGPDTADSDSVICDNCRAHVPVSRLTMHQIVCQRHNWRCPQCSRIFKNGSREAELHWHCPICLVSGEAGDEAKHNSHYHEPATCTCDPTSQFDSLVDLAEHRRTECPERLIECRYCHNIERQGTKSFEPEDIMMQLHSHESYCGNRTIPCAKCKANVRIRQVQVHMRVHAMKDQAARAAMVPCSNAECDGECDSKNVLGLCKTCYGPFYTSEFDSKHLKLLKRLARALQLQMVHGCGRPYCRNKMCATGIRNADKLSVPFSNTEAASKIVPVLRALAPLSTSGPAAVNYANLDMHLCVDEATNKRTSK
ncbi:hypothetical protein EC988_002063 [Linderina pennispora]|nr:hypothetical protein EC988_002063 [Linderina pennispora]